MKKNIYLYIAIISLCLVSIPTVQKVTKSLLGPSDLNDKDINIIKIERFDKKLYGCKTIDDIINLAKEYPDITNIVYSLEPNQSIEEIAKQIFEWMQNPLVKELFNEVNEKFSDCTDIESDLTSFFNNLRKTIPKSKIPKIYFVVSGMKLEIFIKDDIILIGVDCFLGDSNKFKPTVPQHRIHLYARKFIAPQCLIMSLPQYISDNYSDTTLIADMMFYGKIYALAEIIMPKIERQIIFSYTKAQLASIEDNEAYIWDFFMKNNLLYETDEREKNKYIDTRPSITEICSDCPGEVAKWLGYRIVKSYMKNNKSTTIGEILEKKDLKEIFQNSKYKPYI